MKAPVIDAHGTVPGDGTAAPALKAAPLNARWFSEPSEPARNTSWGSAVFWTAGTVVPPVTGKNASLSCPVPKFVSLSDPTYRPEAVARSAGTTMVPRVTPGFQDSGIPVCGSSAATVLRSMAPTPAELTPK